MTQFRENWDVIDAWTADGTLPKKETIPADGAEDSDVNHKDITNARSYITKNKGKLSGDEREKYFEKIQERVDIIINAGEVIGNDLAKELKELGLNIKAD